MKNLNHFAASEVIALQFELVFLWYKTFFIKK